MARYFFSIIFLLELFIFSPLKIHAGNSERENFYDLDEEKRIQGSSRNISEDDYHPSNFYRGDGSCSSLKGSLPCKEKRRQCCPCRISRVSPYNGFYWGVGALLSSLIKEVDIFTDYYPPTRGYAREKFPVYSYDFGAIGFIGGGKTFLDHLYLGIEFSGSYIPQHCIAFKRKTPSDFSSNPGLVKFGHVKSYYSFGGFLRLGCVIYDNALLYLLSGVDLTQFKGRSNKTSDSHVDYYLNETSPLITRFRCGFMPGVGMESILYKNLGLKLQYTYSLNSNFSDGYPIHPPEGIINDHLPNEQMRYDLDRSNFSLALVYNFDTSKNYREISHYLTDEKLFNCCYFGIGGDAATLLGKANLYEHVDVSGNWAKNNYNLCDYNGGFNLFAGGGGGIDRLYLGVEFFMNYSDTESKAFIDSLSAKQKRAKLSTSCSMGPCFRLGYISSKNTLLYTVLGADITKFNMQSDVGKGYDRAYGRYNHVSPKTCKTVTGFLAGIGSEALISRYFSVRFQYAASLFPHFADKYENHPFMGDAENGKMDYVPSRGFCSLTLTYYFRFANKKI